MSTLRTIPFTLRTILFILRTILFIILFTHRTIPFITRTIMVTMGTIIKPPVKQEEEEFLIKKQDISPGDQMTDFLFFLLEGGA
ncbi:hypothetical protein XENTR_v10015665 [Xenopus tropicalis]|nr:hypothetical protein XENTR_v10015665 [Xenopus tropicalis]